jgi:hypothetical protein
VNSTTNGSDLTDSVANNPKEDSEYQHADPK